MRFCIKLLYVFQEKEESMKNPGSDSAVSVGSSDDDETEEQRNIARYFEYLNDDETSGGGSSQRRKKKKKSPKESSDLNQKNLKENNRGSRKDEFEKEGIKHIERHLSMKKTIRKKMMRDLQQAFVEDPKDLQQDPKAMPQEKKANIDISNLTISKKRISKSEHNFLDMLKDDETKEKKSGFKALIDFRKDRQASAAPKQDSDRSRAPKQDSDRSRGPKQTSSREGRNKSLEGKNSEDDLRDDDSGHGSPSREHSRSRIKDLDQSAKDDKKPGFWKRITGKNKAKR